MLRFSVCLTTLAVTLAIAGCEQLQETGDDFSRINPISSTSPINPDQSIGIPSSDTSSVAGTQRHLGFYEPGSDQFARQVKPPPPTSDEPGPGDVTLNFNDTDIAEVIQVILGDLLKADYLVEPTVAGSVTLQTSSPLARDALLPTLEMLLRMNGAALVRENGRFQIVPREQALRGLISPQLGDSSQPLPSQFSVRIVPLKFIGASEMQTILEPFALPGSIVRVDARRNLLIVAGTSHELARLLETIEIFDLDALSGMSVAMFIPDFVDVDTLSVELGEIFSEQGAESQASELVRFLTIERLNALLVITPRRQVLTRVSEWVDRLDQDSGGQGQRLFIYRLQNGKAIEIASVLSQVFGNEVAPTPVSAAELAPGLEPVQIGSAYELSQQTEEQLEEAPTPSPPVGVDEGLVISETSAIRIIPDEVNNALLIMATGREYAQILAALEELDVVPLQVLIEATIAEITLTNELEHGLEWFFKNHLDSDKVGAGALDLGAIGIAPLAPGFSYALADAAGVVRAVLNTLASESRLNIVSSPSLMVLNNQQATIRVGDEVPITIQQQQATVADSTVVNSIEYRDTGVLLTIIPRVNSGGLVIMDIEQEVSDVAPGTGDNLTPTIQQRIINSTVAVQSGQTVVLGGLIRENKSLVKSGVPLLYKLPLIGPLFGATTQERRRTELVVLITPRVLEDARAAQQITDEFRLKMRSLEPFAKPQSSPSEALIEEPVSDSPMPTDELNRLKLDQSVANPSPSETAVLF